MKKTKTLIELMTAMLGLLGCNAQTTAYQSISAEEFEQLIADEDIVRLDVRTAEEYREGHLAQTLNIDVKNPEFENRALTALPKDKTIAVYCRSGNRSKKACDILSRNGYTVKELATGIKGWESAGKTVTKEEVDVFCTAEGTRVRLYCIKHGSVRMEVGGCWIYVDPVAEAIPPVTDYSTLPKADYILITHEHHDHLDPKAISQLTKEETVLITNPRSSELLTEVGQTKKAAIMKNGDTLPLGAWTLDAVAAYNTSADKQQFHPKGRDNGYVLTIEGLRIYIAGDTEDIPEMETLKDIDIAFLPCNLPYTMTPEQVAKAVKTIRPRVLFPYHYGQTAIEHVQHLLEGSGVDVRIRQYQ